MKAKFNIVCELGTENDTGDFRDAMDMVLDNLRGWGTANIENAKVSVNKKDIEEAFQYELEEI